MYSVCVYIYTGTIVLYMASVQCDSYVIGKFIEYNIFIFWDVSSQALFMYIYGSSYLKTKGKFPFLSLTSSWDGA